MIVAWHVCLLYVGFMRERGREAACVDRTADIQHIRIYTFIRTVNRVSSLAAAANDAPVPSKYFLSFFFSNVFSSHDRRGGNARCFRIRDLRKPWEKEGEKE